MPWIGPERCSIPPEPHTAGGAGNLPASVTVGQVITVPRERLVFLRDGQIVFGFVPVAHFNFDSVWKS